MRQVCTCCNLEKPIEEFRKRKDQVSRGTRAECKPCLAAKSKVYREANKEKLKEKFLLKYHAQVEVRREKARLQYQTRKEKAKTAANAYYHNNKEKANESRLRRQKERLKTDPIFKLKRNLRGRLYDALRFHRMTKRSKLSEYIGLPNFEMVKQHIESTFTPEMTWDNYGGYWDIDHIVPLSSAKNEDILHKLCHYTNLRAMEKVANRIEKAGSFDFNREMTVRLIDYRQGQDFLLEHHYLKRECPSEYTFGAFLSNGCLVGVATFATPFSPGLKRMVCGEEEKLNVIELNRLAVKDYMPKNTESWFVSKCLNSGEIKKDILVTFADTAEGHTGVIYKALNFIYTGTTKPVMEYNSPTHSFSAVKDPNRAEMGYRRRSVKHRYVYFIRNRKRLLKKLLLPSLPYP